MTVYRCYLLLMRSCPVCWVECIIPYTFVARVVQLQVSQVMFLLSCSLIYGSHKLYSFFSLRCMCNELPKYIYLIFQSSSFAPSSLFPLQLRLISELFTTNLIRISFSHRYPWHNKLTFSALDRLVLPINSTQIFQFRFSQTRMKSLMVSLFQVFVAFGILSDNASLHTMGLRGSELISWRFV